MATPAPHPIPEALKQLYGARKLLADAFPQHTFTIDGKIVGDIGEAIAQAAFGLEKLRTGSKDHDMRTVDARLVQVKATQLTKACRSVGLGLVKRTFDYLLVLEFDADGNYEVLFNGPGRYVDEARAHKASPSMSRLQLRACQKTVPENERLCLVNPATAPDSGRAA